MSQFCSLFIFAFALFFNASSQDSEIPNMELSFSGGLAVPLGTFSKKELPSSNSHCGCAKTNGSLGAKLRFRLKQSNFYIGGGLQRTWNVYDGGPLIRNFFEEYNGDFAIETDSWKSTALNLGLSYDLLLSNDEYNFFNWFLSFEASGILRNLETYSFETTHTNSTSIYPTYQRSINNWNGGFSCGIGVLAFAEDLFNFRISIEYLSTSHGINGITRNFSDGTNTPIEFNQKVQQLLIQAGLVFQLHW